MRPCVLEKENDKYDKMADAILFETQETAQKILDDQFPGHTVMVTHEADSNAGYAEIKNNKNEIVVRMSW